MWDTVLYQCLLLVSAQDDPDLVVTTVDGPDALYWEKVQSKYGPKSQWKRKV